MMSAVEKLVNIVYDIFLIEGTYCGYEMSNGKCIIFFPLRNVRWLRLGLWREEPSTPWVSIATIIQSEKCHGKGNFETFGMFEKSCSIWFQSVCFFKEITLAQVALVWGDNDVLVEPEDLERIKKEIPNIVMNFKVSFTMKIKLFLWNIIRTF